MTSVRVLPVSVVAVVDNNKNINKNICTYKID